MNTCFFRINRLFLLLGLLLGLACCQKDVDESPQILNMSIAGIPPDNITIDQAQRLITVVLPPTLPSLDLAPSFIFSRQAHLADPISINLTGYCPYTAAILGGDSKTVAKLVDRVDNKHQSTHYTFVFQSGGPLRIKPVSTPIVYDANVHNNQPLRVPVENYYGSSFIEYIAVTKTDLANPNWIGPGGSNMENCEGLLNEIGLSLTGYWVGGMEGETPSTSLKPGLHDLDLRLADGTKLHAEGYILIK